jgi:hypothetical protein
MRQTSKLENEWAWSQIEVYVDDGLDDVDAARMRTALAEDRRLADALERARRVRAVLRALPTSAPRLGMLWRLLGIPRGADMPWLWATAPVAAGALAVGVALWVTAPSSSALDERAIAIQEFRIAMTYLNRTAEVTRNEVGDALVYGFGEALTVGRGVLDEESENGD